MLDEPSQPSASFLDCDRLAAAFTTQTYLLFADANASLAL